MDPERTDKLILAIEEFRGVYPLIPGQALQLILEVARKPGMTQRELEDRVRVSRATVSSTVAKLSDVGDASGPGLELISKRRAPLDQRASMLTITPLGRYVIRRALAHLAG